MTDKQVALKLKSIFEQLVALEEEMVSGGYDEESMGVLSVASLYDSVYESARDFANNDDCLEEVFPDDEE